MQRHTDVSLLEHTVVLPTVIAQDARWRYALRARYLVAAVSHGLTLAEIAGDVLDHGLATVYAAGHAEWELWSALRKSSAPSPSWSWPLNGTPGQGYLLAAVLGQAVRDLERAMPCSLGLFRRDLGWPWVSDCHCAEHHHACAANAAAFLRSKRAIRLYTLLDLDPAYAVSRASRLQMSVARTNPWLTFATPPAGARPSFASKE